MPADVRAAIGKLQLPFLRAAMQVPAMLHEPGHAARHLLNRIGTVAAGLKVDNALDASITSDIERLVDQVVLDYDEDPVVFEEACLQFEQLMASAMTNADPNIALCVKAIKDAERRHAVLANANSDLDDLLTPLKLDPRVADFVSGPWLQVMVHPLLNEIDDPATVTYQRMLPELLWSVQEKQTPQDRSALMRLLPELVKRLKQGFASTGMSPEQAKLALDPLIEVHTEVLRMNQESPQVPLGLVELRQHFAAYSIDLDSARWQLEEQPVIAEEMLAGALVREAAKAQLHMAQVRLAPLAADADWMMQMQVGVCVEILFDDNAELARLHYVGGQRSLFLFCTYQSARALVYSASNLLRSLRDGSIRPIEYAPLFERAVEAVMASTEMLPKAG